MGCCRGGPAAIQDNVFKVACPGPLNFFSTSKSKAVGGNNSVLFMKKVVLKIKSLRKKMAKKRHEHFFVHFNLKPK